MKILKYLSTAFVLMSVTAVPVYAETSSYVTVDVMNWTFDQTVSPVGKASGTGFRLIYGSEFSEALAWEAHLGFGGSGATGGPLGTISLGALAGVFLRGNLSFGKGDIHALVGVSSAVFSNPSSITRQAGISYGFGAQYDFGESFGIRADYLSYVKNSNWSASAVTVGANFKF